MPPSQTCLRHGLEDLVLAYRERVGAAVLGPEGVPGFPRRVSSPGLPIAHGKSARCRSGCFDHYPDTHRRGNRTPASTRHAAGIAQDYSPPRDWPTASSSRAQLLVHQRSGSALAALVVGPTFQRTLIDRCGHSGHPPATRSTAPQPGRAAAIRVHRGIVPGARPSGTAGRPRPRKARSGSPMSCATPTSAACPI